MQTSHFTPAQAGQIFNRTRPRLAVIHHATVNDASREALVSDVSLPSCLPPLDSHLILQLLLWGFSDIAVPWSALLRLSNAPARPSTNPKSPSEPPMPVRRV